MTSFIPTSTSNKLQIIDRNPEPESQEDLYGRASNSIGYPSRPDHYASPRPDYTVLAQASHPFPATRVTWEPRPSSSRLTSRGEYDREVELIATTGDALRVWEVERAGDWAGGRDGDVDEEDDGFDETGAYAGSRQVGRVGWGRHEPKVRLRERSKLTNVSPDPRSVCPSDTFLTLDLLPSRSGQSPTQPSPPTHFILLVRSLTQPPRHLIHRYYLHPMGYPHLYRPDPIDRTRSSSPRRLLSPAFPRCVRQCRVRRFSSSLRFAGIGTFDHPLRRSQESPFDEGGVRAKGTTLPRCFRDGRRSGSGVGYEESGDGGGRIGRA